MEINVLHTEIFNVDLLLIVVQFELRGQLTILITISLAMIHDNEL